MVAAKEQFPKLTPEEYFAWEEQQRDRHEYLNGEVYAMSGGTINHSDISGNFLALLKAHMRGKGCKVLNSDARVSILNSANYVYPDLSVTCDQRDKTTTQYVTYPCLVVEVLSPSTEAYDRGDKFRMYRRNPSLQEYFLVDSETIAIEIFRRTEQDAWQILNYQAGDVVELMSVNLTFPIEAIYEDIVFEAGAVEET
ncbi:Uma2 family endonuclease [Leptothoe sp. PORK10 BA2]|uniref:Uma2 family endonuclease n=1 Tax=Leptothoe sp. PORK10 BA2 TaxID=3110254 RepID=UPI002B2010CD|nr:Uma2 family endonuclease [Leptothoe sp. PORK10 BA2]MEA5466880.1 Uma2 family endonuclease [Leptothoe sp. PORK10 BA2]